MPFDSRAQQQWYHATGQDFLDDEPSSARKVESDFDPPDPKMFDLNEGGVGSGRKPSVAGGEDIMAKMIAQGIPPEQARLMTSKMEAKPLTLQEAENMIQELQVKPMTDAKKIPSRGSKGPNPKNWTPTEFRKVSMNDPKLTDEHPMKENMGMGQPCPVCGVPQESHMGIQDHPFLPNMPQENQTPPMPTPDMGAQPPMPPQQPNNSGPPPQDIGSVRAMQYTVSIPNSLSARSIADKRVNEMIREINLYL